MRKNIFLHLLFFFLLTSQLPAFAQEKNLIVNGDFESVGKKFENLWDGVDENDNLHVFGYSAPVVADFDGDKLKDIICGDQAGLIHFYKNVGTNEKPLFDSAIHLPSYVGTYVKPQVVDWNNDGYPDIVAGAMDGHIYIISARIKKDSKSGKDLFVLTGKDPLEIGPRELDLGNYTAPFVYDWDGDKNKDLILGEGSYSANSIYAYLNEGSDSQPRFTESSRNYLAYGIMKQYLTPIVVDWNKDGLPDLLVGEDKGLLNLYLQPKAEDVEKGIYDKDKIVVLPFKKNVDIGGTGRRVTAHITPYLVDWDEDGDLDLIFGSQDGLIRLCLNKGKWQFSSPEALKGKDRLKDLQQPYDWTQQWITGPRSRLNSREGSYLVSGIEATRQKGETTHSGNYALKVDCLDEWGGKIPDDYHGGTVVIIGKSVYLKEDTAYRVTFYTKGKKVKGKLAIYRIGKSTDGSKRGLSWVGTYIVFSPSGNDWKKISKQVFMPSLPIEKQILKENAHHYTLEFFIEGKGHILIDDITLEAKKAE